MAEVVKLPQWGLSMEEGTIREWMVGPGDEVEQGEVIAQVESEKAVMDLPSPMAGVFVRALAEEDETVEVGAEICVIAADLAEYERLAKEAV